MANTRCMKYHKKKCLLLLKNRIVYNYIYMDSKGKKLLFFRKYLLEIMRLTIKHDSIDKKAVKRQVQ